MDEAVVEDFRVDNDGAPLHAVAAEILDRLGWGSQPALRELPPRT
jgi:hypothetical protein